MKFLSGCCSKQGIYLTSEDRNGLFFMDFDEGIISFVGVFKKGDGIAPEHCDIRKCLCYGNKIFFLPCVGTYGWIYDEEIKQLSSFRYADLDYDLSDAGIYKNKIVLLPRNPKMPVLTVDVDTLKTESIEWDIKSKTVEYGDVFTRGSFDRNNVVFATRGAKVNYLAFVNLDEGRIDEVKVSNIKWVNATLIKGNFVFVLGKKRDGEDVLFEYTLDGSRFIREINLELPEKLFDDYRLRYFQLDKCENTILFFPAYGKDLIGYDVEKKTMWVKEVTEKNKQTDECVYYSDIAIYDRDFLLIPKESNHLAVFSMDTYNVESVEVTVSIEERVMAQKAIGFCYESEDMRLEDWIFTS